MQGQAQTLSMWGNVQAGGYFDDQEIKLTDDPRCPGCSMNLWLSTVLQVNWCGKFAVAVLASKGGSEATWTGAWSHGG